ncbi:uncharacterized protein LOC143757790 [Siphateles boraxobius]|uniref:uncharacterized protein LOC143757790 n=1 Tax=Siphateles boraxobius TaxID=180520 RepID=UPI004062F1BA
MFSDKSLVWIFVHQLASRELDGSPMSTEPSKYSCGMDKRTLPMTKASTHIVLQHMDHLAVASTTAEVQGRAKKGIKLKGNLKGFTYLTNPQLRQHMEAAINIGMGDLKARFGSLLKDETSGPQ